MNKSILLIINLIFCSLLSYSQENPWQGTSIDLKHGKLKISENKRFLIHEDGTLFSIWATPAGNCSIA